MIQPARRIPYAREEKLKATLKRLEEQGIVASVDQATDWVSNLVITEKKNGSIRVCLDPKPLNTAIKRERHMIPTPADVQRKLSGCKTFTVLDMRDAFWHVRLSGESSYKCTFNTPWGRKRFLRMPFGISSASEVLQKRNEETFGDIAGVHIIADDIIIGARDDKEHDDTLLKVMERARGKNAKFSKDKIQFKVGQVRYMGNLVTGDGLKPDNDKIKAILEMPQPTDTKSLQRLLGMVKYLAQYIPNESDITAPLRELLKQDAEWKWQPHHDKAMEKTMNALTRAPVLRFYDVNQPVQIECDASQTGLGACLLQDGKPVAYASRAMTQPKTRYAQIEKEMLAICFACHKFHQYIYGKDTLLETDDKPLQAIFNKPVAMASPRLQRMLVQRQRYSLKVSYKRGTSMYLSDVLSRVYITDTSSALEQEMDMEVLVHTFYESRPVSRAKK